MLDINLLRADKGGNVVRTHAPAQRRRRLRLTGLTITARACAPQDAVRESERRRYADPTLVDKVIELDAVWREGASLSATRRSERRGARLPFGRRRA